jgi:type II secretory pathway component PulJ
MVSGLRFQEILLVMFVPLAFLGALAAGIAALIHWRSASDRRLEELIARQEALTRSVQAHDREFAEIAALLRETAELIRAMAGNPRGRE